MKKKDLILIGLGVLVTSISCSFVTGLASGGGAPENLTAELTAPDVVRLTWDAVEGATGYLIEMSIEDSEFFPIVSFAAEYTNYEDLTAPEKSRLQYRVQAVKESGLGGTSTVTIETQERVPDPLAVTPIYEENTVSEVIGPQGGTLHMVDSNGVEYTLSIPEGALSIETEIRMTPVAEIQGWPLDGDSLGAVKLEPEGLILNEVATLSIGFPFDVNPSLSIVGIAFQASGEEFHLSFSSKDDLSTTQQLRGGSHLASLLVAPKNIVRMPVVELKINGTGQSSGSNASQLVKENAPSDPGAAFQQKQAASDVVDNELTPLPNLYPSAHGVREAAQIGAAIHVARNCRELNSQIASYQLLEASGYDSTATVDQQRRNRSIVEKELKDKIKQILEEAADECEKSSEQGSPTYTDSGCAKELLNKLANPSGRFWTNISSLMNSEISQSEAEMIKEKLDKCKRKAYFISGDVDEAHMQGYTCDSSKPFKIGGTLTFEFIPTNEKFGNYTYTGPFNATGNGPYLIYGDGTMKISGYGCVDSFFGTECADYDHLWTAEPIDPEQCTP